MLKLARSIVRQINRFTSTPRFSINCVDDTMRLATLLRPTSLLTRSHIMCSTCWALAIPSIRFSDAAIKPKRTARSVRLELQADYLAGVWAHHAHREYNILEDGDIAEAINAANQIGDDTLMKQQTGFVIPARFTHGTSEQRVRWFKQGLVSGDMAACSQLFQLDYSQL